MLFHVYLFEGEAPGKRISTRSCAVALAHSWIFKVKDGDPRMDSGESLRNIASSPAAISARQYSGSVGPRGVHTMGQSCVVSRSVCIKFLQRTSTFLFHYRQYIQSVRSVFVRHRLASTFPKQTECEETSARSNWKIRRVQRVSHDCCVCFGFSLG